MTVTTVATSFSFLDTAVAAVDVFFGSVVECLWWCDVGDIIVLLLIFGSVIEWIITLCIALLLLHTSAV